MLRGEAEKGHELPNTQYSFRRVYVASYIPPITDQEKFGISSTLG